MNLRIKSTVAAALLAAGSAFAAPAMQTCSPMEVLHDSVQGLSYNLSCTVGDWDLKYRGAVPAGMSSVLVNYKLTAQSKDGSNFTLQRQARLPSPTLLGQTLLREAVLLDDGQLALRDCPEISCSKYRPLGDSSKLTKATVTVTPELAQLREAHAMLTASLASTQAQLASRVEQVSNLESDIQRLTTALADSSKAQGEADRAHIAQLEQERASHAQAVIDQSAKHLSEMDQLHFTLVERFKKANTEAGDAGAASTQPAASSTGVSAAEQQLQKELAAAVADRDKAEEAIQILTKEAVQLVVELETLGSAYQTLKTESLKLVDELTRVSTELGTVQAELDSTRLALSMAEAKTQAATLARDLSMQAADVAHLDANAMNMNLQMLQKQLQVRDSTIAELKTELNGKVKVADELDKNTVAVSSDKNQNNVPNYVHASPVELAIATSGDLGVSHKTLPATSKAQSSQVIDSEALKLRKQLDELLPELYALRWKAEKEARQGAGKP
ncbi:hypothetical protein [Comamonas thiooxydans]|uniref:hypothetical protein n=1 Tax=Comamonas thiooxydans TaxID=363952 RepID=UPI001186AD20|nr:hypothetical protein [Comamonas thiooxydans]